MKKIVRFAGSIFLLVILLFYAFNFETVNYGARQAKGQVMVLLHTELVSEKLADKDFPDSLKYKIELIKAIRKFSEDSLGLNPSGSYETYYEQNGKPLIWVITASEPYRLEPYIWRFPLFGQFPYKGHFEEWRTTKEAQELKKQGLDVRIGEVSAWSTLGYLNDPILSSMLTKSEGQLAALILHELTHGTLFVRDNLEFNENLADFVGDHGARIFLESRYGPQSRQLNEYLQELDFQKKYADHMRSATMRLDSLFQTFTPEMASNVKDSLKYNLIDEIMLQAVRLDRSGRLNYKGRGSVNNAYFTAFKTYQAKQTYFEKEFKSKFNSNFKLYLKYLKKKYAT